jgi:hypothetical protein
VIQPQFNDLVISTYGRGFWILDDLTPLQQMTKSVTDSNAYLFPPRITYRFRNTSVLYSVDEDPTAGQNPPYGAIINYYLKSVPAGDVKILIVDPKGQTVREADIQAQMEMLTELRKDLEGAADMVNQVEMVRSQLDNLRSVLRGSSEAASIIPAADDMEKKFTEVEDRLIQRKLTGQGQDSTRWPAMLVSKITYLAGGLSNSDSGPTTQQRQVHAMFKEQLAALRRQLDELVSGDLDAFNKLLRERNVQNIIAKTP